MFTCEHFFDSSIEFSPDSRFAVQANMDVPDEPKHMALVALGALPLKALAISSPIDVKTLGDYRMSEAKWSLDSRQIYLGMIAFVERGGAPNCAYFSYDVNGKTFKKIDGRFVNSAVNMTADEGLHYIIDGREAPAYAAPPPGPSAGAEPQPCINGKCP